MKKTIILLFILNTFILKAQNTNNEINQLEIKRKEYNNKIKSLKDSILLIDKKINILNHSALKVQRFVLRGTESPSSISFKNEI